MVPASAHARTTHGNVPGASPGIPAHRCIRIDELAARRRRASQAPQVCPRRTPPLTGPSRASDHSGGRALPDDAFRRDRPIAGVGEQLSATNPRLRSSESPTPI